MNWIPGLLVLALAALTAYDVNAGRRGGESTARRWHQVRAVAALLLALPVLLPTVLGNVNWPALLLPLVATYLLGGIALIVSTTALFVGRDSERAGE